MVNQYENKKVIVSLKKTNNGEYYFYKNGKKSKEIYTPNDFLKYKSQKDDLNYTDKVNLKINKADYDYYFDKK